MLVQNGYFDGSICNFFNTKYTLWQITTSKSLKERTTWKGYPCGHMIYMDKQSMIKGNEDIRQFILQSIPEKNKSSDYNVMSKSSGCPNGLLKINMSISIAKSAAKRC